LATLVAYATVSAPSWWDRRERLKASPALAAGSLALVAGVFLQIVLGAVMRHQQAGLIIYDFPLNYGHILPTFYSPLVALNFAHRVGGWLLATLGAGFAGRIAFDRGLDPWVRRPAALFLGAVLAQFLLGACVVWTHLTEPVLTSAHVVGGSVLLSTAVVLALRLRRLSVEA
jgi:cytochrome c oxidase assembly protein subunit 15